MKNQKVLIFVHDEYEDLELQYPRYRLLEAGIQSVIAGPEAGKVYKGKHGYPCKAEIALKDVKEGDLLQATCIGSSFTNEPDTKACFTF